MVYPAIQQTIEPLKRRLFGPQSGPTFGKAIAVGLLSGIAIGSLSAIVEEAATRWDLAWRNWPELQSGDALPTELKRAIADATATVPGALAAEDLGFERVADRAQVTPLYLIDLRISPRMASNPLCGAAGCPVWGYVFERDRYRRVFEVYIPNVQPPGEDPIAPVQVSPRQANGLPCLNARGMADDGQLAIVTWCYDGRAYQPAF